MIENVNNLMKLNRDELDEILLQDKYSKAYLRELVRRTLKVANNYKDSYEYLKNQKEIK